MMRVWEAAVEVLRETDNAAVMWGDETLLHMIAARAGLRSAGQGSKTSKMVLSLLSRQPGIFAKGMTRTGRGRLVRIFRLPTA